MEENKCWQQAITDIINDQAYKLDNTGRVKWRSGMDAGSGEPHFLGLHIKDVINNLLEQEAAERESYIEVPQDGKPSQMFEVWMEGYMATGESALAHKVGEVLCKTFDEAVLILTEGKVDLDENEPDGLKRNSTGNLCSWACAFYDNEADARKSFG